MKKFPIETEYLLDKAVESMHQNIMNAFLLPASSMTSTNATATETVLTIDHLMKTMEMLKSLPKQHEAKPKDEFKSWPYAMED